MWSRGNELRGQRHEADVDASLQYRVLLTCAQRRFWVCPRLAAANENSRTTYTHCLHPECSAIQPPHASHNAATVLMLSNKELVLHPAGSSD